MGVQGEKTIKLRYPGRCVVCGRELGRGEQGVWDGASRTVRCVSCPAGATTADATETSVDPGVAGASAKRKYERMHAAREQRARDRMGGVGVLLARATGDPTGTKVWKQGAEGEERTAKRLEKLLRDSGVMLLHDRRIPRHGQANIDHLAVGPGGVTVIDSKTHRGKVRVRSVGGLFSPKRQELRIGGRNSTKLVQGVTRQAGYVRDALASGEFANVEVRCALCFPKPEGLPLLRRLEIDGVMVDGPRRVAALARREGAAQAEEVERLWRELARLFPAAGRSGNRSSS